VISFTQEEFGLICGVLLRELIDRYDKDDWDGSVDTIVNAAPSMFCGLGHRAVVVRQRIVKKCNEEIARLRGGASGVHEISLEEMQEDQGGDTSAD